MWCAKCAFGHFLRFARGTRITVSPTDEGQPEEAGGWRLEAGGVCVCNRHDTMDLYDRSPSRE